MMSVAIFFSACQKENIDTFLPDDGQGAGADTNWVTHIDPFMPVVLLKADLSIPNYIDSIDITDNDTDLIFSSGLQCLIKANTLTDANNLPVTGKIAMQNILAQKKGDMIRLDKSTISNNYVLSSAGMFFIKLTKDGYPLILTPQSKLNVKYRETLNTPLIKLFNGITTPQGAINWYPDNDPNNDIIPFSEGYEVKTNQMGWINAGYVIDSAISKNISINIDLAKHFTNTNTIAWLVFKEYRSVINFSADAVSRKFLCTGIPSNKEATVIVISKQVNDYYMASKDITTSAIGSTPLSVAVTPVKTSLDALLQYLNSL